MYTLPDIQKVENIAGKRVLLRTGLNVSLREEEMAGQFRIRKSLETIQFLEEKKARIILLSHISSSGQHTLRAVFEELKKHINLDFLETWDEETVRGRVNAIRDGEILLLENTREHEGEENNSDDFARFLASLGDMYVNDAFSASHRNHASIVGVPKFLPHYAGVLFQREVKKLSRAFQPKSPSVLILGGAKFETKEPLIQKFLDKYDKVFIGGAIAHDFFKKKGLNVGQSLTSDNTDVIDLPENEKLVFPTDVIVMRDGEPLMVGAGQVLDNDVIVDAGEKTAEILEDLVRPASFVLWNGPLGNYEKGFSKRTEELAYTLAESSAETIIGGGDTVASIEKLNLEEKFTFVSTGGGAMIDFLSDGTVPGMEALRV